MQHDDDQRDICTKRDVCDILILNSPRNKFVGLFAWLSLLQNPLAPQHQMCKSLNPNSQPTLWFYCRPNSQLPIIHVIHGLTSMVRHTILAMSTTILVHPSKDHSSNLPNFGSCTNKKDHPSKVHSHIEPTLMKIHP